MANIVSVEIIATKIFETKGKKVMLDSDLAKLYRVQTKHLTRQVRRNIKRFPSDFMIQLTKKEYQELLRCQIGTFSRTAETDSSNWLSYPLKIITFLLDNARKYVILQFVVNKGLEVCRPRGLEN